VPARLVAKKGGRERGHAPNRGRKGVLPVERLAKGGANQGAGRATITVLINLLLKQL